MPEDSPLLTSARPVERLVGPCEGCPLDCTQCPAQPQIAPAEPLREGAR